MHIFLYEFISYGIKKRLLLTEQIEISYEKINGNSLLRCRLCKPGNNIHSRRVGYKIMSLNNLSSLNYPHPQLQDSQIN
jgi:hypothetical protein